MKKTTLYLALAGALSLGAATAVAIPAASPDGAPRRAPEGKTVTPNQVTDLKARWNIDKNCAEVSMTAPTQGFYWDSNFDEIYEDLTAIEKITVSYSESYWSDPTVVHTFEAPAPGEQLSCEITTLPAGQDITLTVEVFANGTSSYEEAEAKVFTGAKPGIVTGAAVTTDKGKAPVRMTFTTPATFAGTDAVPAKIDRVRVYTSEYNYSTYDNDIVERAELLDAEPGKEYTVDIDAAGMKENNQYSFYTECYIGGIKGEPVITSFYFGVDHPKCVNALKAAEQPDGTVLLIWEAPTEGYSGGYVDPASCSYEVSLTAGTSSTKSVIANGLTDCSYVYTPEFTEPTLVKLSVVPYNTSGRGREVATSLIVGPALELPFADTFDKAESNYATAADNAWAQSNTTSETYPRTWQFAQQMYTDKGAVTPPTGQGGLAYFSPYSSTVNGEYYLTSSKINVAGSEYLEFSMSYYTPSAIDQALRAEASFDSGEWIELVAADMKTAAAGEWNAASKGFAVPAGAKNVILRIAAVKKGDTVDAMGIDNVKLTSSEAPTPVYPASVSDLQASLDRAAKHVKVTMKAPEKSHASLGEINDQPLERIDRIDLFRCIGYSTEYQKIHSFVNPTPGAELEFLDTDIAVGGEYFYKAIVYIGQCSDYGQFLDAPVMVGQIPAYVTDFTLTSNKGAAPVTITFKAPENDRDGQPMEEPVTARVTRMIQDTFQQMDIAVIDSIAPGETRTVIDSKDIASDEIYTYSITLTASAGTSSATQRTVYVGVDQPDVATNVKAEVNEEGKVVVTWEPPTGGINNGYIDYDNLVYRVVRLTAYSDYDYVELATGIDGLSYTDETVFDDEGMYRYGVSVTSMGILGYSGISNYVAVGPKPTVPYLEGFERVVGENIHPDHLTWTASTNSTSADTWTFATQAMSVLEGIWKPAQGKGLAYVYYGHYNSDERDDYLTSGEIDIENVSDPTISYYIYMCPGYDNITDIEISVDGGEFQSVMTHMHRGAEASGWVPMEFSLETPKGAKTLRLRIHAHKGAYSSSTAIDHIQITDGTVGIRDIAREEGALILGGEGRIAVIGAGDARVAVYSANGACVYAAEGDCSVSVEPGVYVVKAGAKTAKLIVR